MGNEQGVVLSPIGILAAIDLGDDLGDDYKSFVAEASTQTIREGDDYQGVRVSLPTSWPPRGSLYTST